MKMQTIRLADLYDIPIEKWDDEDVILKMISIIVEWNKEKAILKCKEKINDVSNWYG